MKPPNPFHPLNTAKAILAGESPYEGLAVCIVEYVPALAKPKYLAAWLADDAYAFLPPSIVDRAKDRAALLQSLNRAPLVRGCVRALLRDVTGKTLYVRRNANNLLPDRKS